jgi:hypothetical protein
VVDLVERSRDLDVAAERHLQPVEELALAHRRAEEEHAVDLLRRRPEPEERALDLPLEPREVVAAALPVAAALLAAEVVDDDHRLVVLAAALLGAGVIAGVGRTGRGALRRGCALGRRLVLGRGAEPDGARRDERVAARDEQVRQVRIALEREHELAAVDLARRHIGRRDRRRGEVAGRDQRRVERAQVEVGELRVDADPVQVAQDAADVVLRARRDEQTRAAAAVAVEQLVADDDRIDLHELEMALRLELDHLVDLVGAGERQLEVAEDAVDRREGDARRLAHHPALAGQHLQRVGVGERRRRFVFGRRRRRFDVGDGEGAHARRLRVAVDLEAADAASAQVECEMARHGARIIVARASLRDRGLLGARRERERAISLRLLRSEERRHLRVGVGGRLVEPVEPAALLREDLPAPFVADVLQRPHLLGGEVEGAHPADGLVGEIAERGPPVAHPLDEQRGRAAEHHPQDGVQQEPGERSPLHQRLFGAAFGAGASSSSKKLGAAARPFCQRSSTRISAASAVRSVGWLAATAVFGLCAT